MQGLIRLLPALPKDIPDGSLSGIRGRGGVICDLTWKGGQLESFCMTVSKDGIYRIVIPEPEFILSDNGTCENGINFVECQAGKKYVWSRVL